MHRYLKKLPLVIILSFFAFNQGLAQDQELEEKLRQSIRKQITAAKSDGQLMFNFDDIGVDDSMSIDPKLIEKILMEEMAAKGINMGSLLSMAESELEGKILPDFQLRTINRKSISSESTWGKVLVINMWFIACKPCIMEIPILNQVVEEYEGKNVEFLAVTFDKKKDVKKFLKKQPFNYRHVSDAMDYVKSLKINIFPTHLVVDKEGTILKVITGYSPQMENKLKGAIDRALKT